MRSCATACVLYRPTSPAWSLASTTTSTKAFACKYSPSEARAMCRPIAPPLQEGVWLCVSPKRNTIRAHVVKGRTHPGWDVGYLKYLSTDTISGRANMSPPRALLPQCIALVAILAPALSQAVCGPAAAGASCPGDLCCDANGACGKTAAHCSAASCQPEYGTCIANVCGNGVCDSPWMLDGESCGNCPLDCGPCQAREVASQCVESGVIALTIDDGPTVEAKDGPLQALETTLTAKVRPCGKHTCGSDSLNSYRVQAVSLQACST
jgi:hypothetical protein